MLIRLALFLILIGIVFYLLLPSKSINNIVTPIKHFAAKNQVVKPTPHPTITLEQIFRNRTQTQVMLASDRTVTLIATGDVIPSRSVNYQAVTRNDFTWAFRETADLVKDADITFINLETPLLKDCPLTQEGMIFCGSERHIEGIKLIGTDVASLANNHAGNWGESGVEETKKLLIGNGISVTGVDGPVYKQVRGVRFAFLGYSDIDTPLPYLSWAKEERIQKEIREARKQADVVIVTYHWGAEYRDQPDERQRYLGHLTIDAGADLVIGNHPHWIQPVEIYKGKLITYAHGNYVFDQEWSVKTKQGVIGKYTFDGNQLVDVQYFPVAIRNYGQSYFPDVILQSSILAEMHRNSKKLL
jgi:poly-gamma-glutamate capsule biosynthesis protein CapA/YwtB (metallophosphatase superfamily)